MTFILKNAIKIEKQINTKLSRKKDPFGVAKASLWLLDDNNKIKSVKENNDVYDMLDDFDTLESIKDCASFTILTAGWAAPINETNEDTPPSQHPKKRRVRLIVHATEFGVASVMRFKDKADEIVTDDGKAKGSLAEAVMDLMDKKINYYIKREGV
jgi:hypothetical protein